MLSDEHQLMLNRLGFELVERSRFVLPVHTYRSIHTDTQYSLDKRKTELEQEKEELLKESRSKLSTMDSVKSQIDMLMKVSDNVASLNTHLMALL